MLEVVDGAGDLGEQHLGHQYGPFLDLADALPHQLFDELLPVLKRRAVLVERRRTPNHIVQEEEDIHAEEHYAHLLLEGDTVKVTMDPLQLGFV